MPMVLSDCQAVRVRVDIFYHVVDCQFIWKTSERPVHGNVEACSWLVLPGRNIPIVSSDAMIQSWIRHARVTIVDVESARRSGEMVRIDFCKFKGNIGGGVAMKSWWNTCCSGGSCCRSPTASDDGIMNVNWIESIQQSVLNDLETSDELECKVDSAMGTSWGTS